MELPLRSPVRRLVRPIQEFMRLESSSGLVLIGCTALALAWANAAAGYERFWETPLRVGLGGFVLSHSLREWINEGLMTLFFLLVGLEIKREVLVGELAGLRRAALPVAAALGGMAVPGLLYAAVAGGPGWGIPMATDIAFALGLLALLGRRVPAGLTVFLAALAIADDLGAVALIALVYSHGVSLAALAVGLVLFGALLLSSRLGVRSLTWYGLLGLAMWVAFLHSGVHATVSGVLLALAVPAWSRIHAARFREGADRLVADLHRLEGAPMLGNQRVLAVARAMETDCRRVQPPLHRLEHSLAPWVAMGVVPLFALANAGVAVQPSALLHPVSQGIAAGLLVGKPLGIVGGAWLAVRLGLARLPAGVRWPHLWGAGLLGGVGFTMSLFIAGLALEDLDVARMGILASSALAGLAGLAVLRRVG